LSLSLSEKAIFVFNFFSYQAIKLKRAALRRPYTLDY
jgi:hypothetical protein